MPDAPTAIRWPLNADSRVSDMLDNASPQVLERLAALKKESATIRATRRVKAEQADELRARIADRGRRISILTKEEKRHGPSRKEIHKPGQNGVGETVEVIHTGALAKLHDEQARDQAELKKFTFPARVDWYGKALEDLAANSTRQLVEESDVIEWRPDEGEESAAEYFREWEKTKTLEAEEDRIWNAPRTVAEVTERAVKEMVARCKSIDFGGFRRGHSFDYAGTKRIATPDARVGFPDELVRMEYGQLGKYLPDAIGLFLGWLGPKEVERWTRERIAAAYTDEGAMSEADKRLALIEIGERLWHQRRILEAAYCYCRAQGITNLNRPKKTPVEIILGVIPFSKSPNIRIANTTPVKPEGEKELTALDFEGPADDDNAAETAAA